VIDSLLITPVEWSGNYTCGVKLLEYRYELVWSITKRGKQSPIGRFL